MTCGNRRFRIRLAHRKNREGMQCQEDVGSAIRCAASANRHRSRRAIARIAVRRQFTRDPRSKAGSRCSARNAARIYQKWSVQKSSSAITAESSAPILAARARRRVTIGAINHASATRRRQKNGLRRIRKQGPSNTSVRCWETSFTAVFKREIGSNLGVVKCYWKSRYN